VYTKHIVDVALWLLGLLKQTNTLLIIGRASTETAYAVYSVSPATGVIIR